MLEKWPHLALRADRTHPAWRLNLCYSIATQSAVLPNVSATTAPRLPMGRGGPVVESMAV